MCVIEFEECASVWREIARRARKQHRCSCCRRTIEPGETYIVHFSIFDGSCTSEKCCDACNRDREEFAAAHGGATMNPGWFIQMLADCISDDDEEDPRWVAMLDRIRKVRTGG